MPDKTYRDSNGGMWLIITDEQGHFFGTPSPAATDRRYDPMPPDTAIFNAEGAAAAAIEKYAREHRADIGLVVRAKGDRSWLVVLVVLGALALLSEDS